jgi:hypothetical protein
MQLDVLIAQLSADWEPMRDLAVRLRVGGARESEECFALSHRPHVAPEAYALWLYPPISEAALARYQRIHQLVIPSPYLRLLRSLNGARAFELSLFGAPPSMAAEPPLLSRTGFSPFDLATANHHWKSEYSVPDACFHFGVGPYSENENFGYFLDDRGNVFSSRRNGERVRVWASFSEFLVEELRRAEAEYPKPR